jgi:hypothetical protein
MLIAGLARGAEPAESFKPLDYRIQLDTVFEHDGGHTEIINLRGKEDLNKEPEYDPNKFFWYHARAAVIPGFGKDGGPAALMTIHKHFLADDHYSGPHVMHSDDLGKTWSKPDPRPELAWVPHSKGITEAVIDSTPLWHARTKKVIVIGPRIHYGPNGEQLHDIPRSRQTMYAIYDPATGAWTRWQELKVPDDEKFNMALTSCSQWLIEDDGTVLLPYFYAISSDRRPTSVTVVQCSFDGRQMKFLRHGDEIHMRKDRGIGEPSLARFQGRYFITIRSNKRGYVVAGDDGLHYGPLTPWLFDDGAELGSYNTQQHWLTHSDGLFLVYTRRGANNDHVQRNRAPLFIAQVDTHKLQVMRNTERVLIPERGGELGNFNANEVDAGQSWVTVSEGVWTDDQRRRGAKGATFVARILWSKPNLLVSDKQPLTE